MDISHQKNYKAVYSLSPIDIIESNHVMTQVKFFVFGHILNCIEVWNNTKHFSQEKGGGGRQENSQIFYYF